MFDETEKGQTHSYCQAHNEGPCCCHHKKETPCVRSTFSGTATFTARCRVCKRETVNCDPLEHDLLIQARLVRVDRDLAIHSFFLFLVACGLLLTVWF